MDKSPAMEPAHAAGLNVWHLVTGNVREGLFFRGAGTLPLGNHIRPVHDLLHRLLGNTVPTAVAELEVTTV